MDDQTSSSIVLDGITLSKCDQCRRIHKGRMTIPPCESCWVELREENRDAARIYMESRGQIITAGMGEPVDINILAVTKLMDLYGIKNQLEVLSMVRRVFHHFLNKRRDINENLTLESPEI